ncbi:hypothetical protein LWI28_001015 [Acer negundo]|uniref:Uncharacterized protein n=1 Tax=Acer negundo TaxID=4023 RepID=A0AAD5J7R2_ACENE|nr:hypothetical protein LWI28_001015 [Acer negundo]
MIRLFHMPKTPINYGLNWDWVKNRGLGGDSYAQTIQFICRSLDSFGIAVVEFCPWVANHFADTLAKKGAASGKENSHATGASDIGNLLRIAHKSVNDLDRVVQDFFKGLPSTNIICISFLEGSYSKLLKDLLSEPSYGNAWMLISRLNSMSQPIVILRPVNEVLEGTLLYNIHG